MSQPHDETVRPLPEKRLRARKAQRYGQIERMLEPS